jgi:hypothetical protein
MIFISHEVKQTVIKFKILLFFDINFQPIIKCISKKNKKLSVEVLQFFSFELRN